MSATIEKMIIASDIHGSAYWCEKLAEACREEGAQKLLLLGDLLYHGPRNPLPDGYDPKKVAEILASLSPDVLSVRGNCDAEVDQMMLPFPVLADYALVCACKRTLFATHGHLYNADSLPPLAAGEILLNGHFHVPCHKPLPGGGIYVNCGSVSLPKEDSPHSYILLQEGEMLWKDLETGGIFDGMEL
ncbi:MAG TPA: phosphodiesterase [Candidatus Scatosoma pullicola]|nr:phosphodiesterase [Candidatus Scatosoma pullicola]